MFKLTQSWGEQEQVMFDGGGLSHSRESDYGVICVYSCYLHTCLFNTNSQITLLCIIPKLARNGMHLISDFVQWEMMV